jgi:anti-anti-sigma regulatory factor
MAPASHHASSGAPTAVEGLLVEIQDLRAPTTTRRLLRVFGEIDLATAGLLRCAIHCAAADHDHVELDVSGVTFCDVAAATATEQAQAQLQARGCQLRLRGIGGPFRRLLAVDALFPTLRRSALLDGQQPPRPGPTAGRAGDRSGNRPLLRPSP